MKKVMESTQYVVGIFIIICCSGFTSTSLGSAGSKSYYNLYHTTIGLPKNSEEGWSTRLFSTFLTNDNSTRYSFSEIKYNRGKNNVSGQIGLTFAQNIPELDAKLKLLHDLNLNLNYFPLQTSSACLGFGGGLKVAFPELQNIQNLPYSSNGMDSHFEILGTFFNPVYNNRFAVHFNLGYYLHMDKNVCIQGINESHKMDIHNTHWYMNIGGQYIAHKVKLGLELWGRKYNTELAPYIFDRENVAYVSPSFEYNLFDGFAFFVGSDIRLFAQRLGDDFYETYNAPKFMMFGGLRITDRINLTTNKDDTLQSESVSNDRFPKIVNIEQIDVLLYQFITYIHFYEIHYDIKKIEQIVINIYNSYSEQVITENYFTLYRYFVSLKNCYSISYHHRIYIISIFEKLLFHIIEQKKVHISSSGVISARQVELIQRKLELDIKLFRLNERLKLRDAYAFLLTRTNIMKYASSFSSNLLDHDEIEWGYIVRKHGNFTRLMAVAYIPSSEMFHELRWELYKNRVNIKSGNVMFWKGNLLYNGVNLPGDFEEGIFDLSIKGKRYKAYQRAQKFEKQFDINMLIQEFGMD